MSHYYSENPDLETKSEPFSFEFYILGKKYKFHSDHGVFSKDYVDFGSNTLLRAISPTWKVENILDVGCGYGPIGIALSNVFTDAKIDMVDINSRAVDLAQKNILENHVNNCKAFQSNIYENVVGTYDLIVTNPPIRAGKIVVHTILSGAYQHLNFGGSIVAVIQKKQGAPSAAKKMEEIFGNVEMISREKGYHVLRSIKKEQTI